LLVLLTNYGLMTTCKVGFCKSCIWLHLVVKYLHVYMQKSLSQWFIPTRWKWCEMPQQNAYKVNPSFRLQHVPSLARFPTKWTYLGYELMPRDYLHTTMSLSHHKTMAFSMPFILAWVAIGNGSLMTPSW